ncbi:uncharacterized protein LOC120359059 [Solenopsis invicta]|uniref:uncharacterized protein LOC120359059 n=1 Tax=Solenopsis invicta TaxID=13686 RepID=UPI00193E0858|nr:uncharacterized protein LOC120359059 [Solenopsis invicta]
MAKKRESHKSSNQDDCVILMDEMDIQPALEYDVSTRSFVGQTTCDEIEKLCTSIVVFMLRGLNENWKQIVSWHLTSKSSNDDIMTQLLFEIVEEAEKIGYKVHGLVCDMGPKNQAIWRNLGIKVSRNNNTPFVMHPIRPNDNFYIFPDIPHLLKNLRMALTNNSIITIALSIVESENLPCNEVRFKYLEELNVIQQRKNLKLAPKITTDIVNPTGFNKMNVAAAAHIFNVKTAAALETLIELKLIDNEAKTTAWFLRKVRAWFDAMNSRKQNEAITPTPIIATILASKDHKDDPQMLAGSYLEIVSEIIRILEPFKEATLQISIDSNITFSIVLPIRHNVHDTLIENKPVTYPAIELKQNLLKEIEAKYVPLEKNKLLTISTLLDPRFKKLYSFSILPQAEAILQVQKN